MAIKPQAFPNTASVGAAAGAVPKTPKRPQPLSKAERFGRTPEEIKRDRRIRQKPGAPPQPGDADYNPISVTGEDVGGGSIGRAIRKRQKEGWAPQPGDPDYNPIRPPDPIPGAVATPPKPGSRWSPDDPFFTPGGADWMDLTGPGLGEQSFLTGAKALRDPSTIKNFWGDREGAFGVQTDVFEKALAQAGADMLPGGVGQDVAGRFADRDAAGENVAATIAARDAPGQADEAYGLTKSRAPTLAELPDLEGYYDNAQRQAFEGLDNQLAAQGAYGSSAGLGLKSEAAQNLGSERASREADYALSRSAENRQWTDLMARAGSAAAGAEKDWFGMSAGAETDWANTVGNLALGAEGMDLSRQEANLKALGMSGDRWMDRQGLGAEIAGAVSEDERRRIADMMSGGATAQTLREGRVGNAFDRALAMGTGLSQQQLDYFNEWSDSDAAILDAELNARTGGALQGTANEATRDEKQAGLVSTVVGAIV